MATYAPGRLRSLMVGAVSPWRNLERGAAFLSFLAQGAEAFVPVWEAQAPISDALKARLRANDVKALMAMQEHRMEHDDNVLDALDGLQCPYRLIAGDEDNLAPYAEIVKFAGGLPEGALITLSGINHLETMQRIDLILPHVTALIQQA
ncbi:MAG: alpha/beta fold hydrolase [Acidimicrobiales bacterium]